MVRVKICCIGSIEEARMAVRHGASALGVAGIPGLQAGEDVNAIPLRSIAAGELRRSSAIRQRWSPP